MHPGVLGNVPLGGDGKSVVKHVVEVLIVGNRYWGIAAFGMDCVARLYGNVRGTQAGRRESKRE